MVKNGAPNLQNSNLDDGDQEAITIDGDRLIMSAGEGDGDLYEIEIEKMHRVQN